MIARTKIAVGLAASLGVGAVARSAALAPAHAIPAPADAIARGAGRRSGDQPTLWAIKRSTSQAMSFTAPYRSIDDPRTPVWQVFGPGHFQE